MNRKSTTESDWSQRLGQRVQDSQVQPSAELWARIEQSTAPRLAPRRNATKWWAAAAAALLLGGIALLEMMDSAVETTLQDVVIAEQSQPREITEDPKTPTIETLAQVSAPQATKPTISRSLRPTTIPPSEPSSDHTTEAESIVEPTPKSAESTKTTVTERPKEQEQSYFGEEESFVASKTKSHTNRLIALNLSGGFGGTASSSSIATQPSMVAMELLSSNGYMTVESTDYYNGGDISHRAPLNLELTAALSLSDRLSLVSGLSYTSLTSDITPLDHDAETMVQRLQFVGVPLSLHYDIIARNNFVLYGGVGGAVERLISAKLDGEKFDEKRWHTSIGAVLGVEYKITKVVGIYAEPELTHYLTTTNLTTRRSESPLDFNVKFGVRFSL